MEGIGRPEVAVAVLLTHLVHLAAGQVMADGDSASNC